jgi:hypothetical protein
MWDKAKIKPVPQGERGHFNPGRRQPDHPEQLRKISKNSRDPDGGTTRIPHILAHSMGHLLFM